MAYWYDSCVARDSSGPEGTANIKLTVAECAWLARVSTETIRRWIRGDQLVAGQSTITWEDLQRHADPSVLAHWSWLQADLSHPANASPELAVPTELDRLRREVADANLARDQAILDAENLDQAAMIYRDNWRRRSQPQSSKDSPTA